MQTPFIGQLAVFASLWIPPGWLECDGRLLPIAGNELLFKAIDNVFGGDGRKTFALPDLRGRVATMEGFDTDGFYFQTGAIGGQAQVTLSAAQIPSHRHAVMGSDAPATSASPVGQVPALAKDQTRRGVVFADITEFGVRLLAEGSVSRTGGGQPHENRQPSLALRWCIALDGIPPDFE